MLSRVRSLSCLCSIDIDCKIRKIIDDSEAESDVQELTWSLWTNINSNDEECAMIDTLRENVVTNKSITFFALDGKKTASGFAVENSKVFFCIQAKEKELKSSQKSPQNYTLRPKLLAKSLTRVSSPLVAITTMNKARRHSVRY